MKKSNENSIKQLNQIPDLVIDHLDQYYKNILIGTHKDILYITLVKKGLNMNYGLLLTIILGLGEMPPII